MSAVELLNPQPGETILDLAAAPAARQAILLQNDGPGTACLQ